MESGLIFHSHSPSFHQWPFSCSLLTPSLSVPPRLLLLCSTHRHRRRDFGVGATGDGKLGRSFHSKFDAGGRNSLYDASRKRGGRKRRRPWWDDEDDNDIYRDEFSVELKRGILDEFIDSFWAFKLLGSYGWALPIIMLSLVLSTGPKAFLTVLLIALGLSVLTFAFRLLWGWTQESSFKFRPKGKKKSSIRKKGTAFTEENEGEMRWTKDRRMMHHAYRSSRSNGSAAYGGWEDLIEEGVMGRRSDKKVGTRTDNGELGTRSGEELGTTRKEEKEAPLQEESNSRVEVREHPLVFRLLVALFPFLSSWVDLL